MSKVFFSVSMSLDGFIAPEGMELEHAGDPTFNDWLSQWDALQNWVSQQRFFRENLGLGEGGETGEDNRILEETFKRTGVSIMGKRMFEGGELYWPEEAPFHTAVYVLTTQARAPWERPGGHPTIAATTTAPTRAGAAKLMTALRSRVAMAPANVTSSSGIGNRPGVGQAGRDCS